MKKKGYMLKSCQRTKNEGKVQLFWSGTYFKVSPGPTSARRQPKYPLVTGQKSISTNIGMLHIKFLEILYRFKSEMETYAQNQLEMS